MTEVTSTTTQNRIATNVLNGFVNSQAYKARGLGYNIDLFKFFCYPVGRVKDPINKPNVVVTNQMGLKSFQALAEDVELINGDSTYTLDGVEYPVYKFRCHRTFNNSVIIGLIVTDFLNADQLPKGFDLDIWAYKNGLLCNHDLIEEISSYHNDPLKEQALRRLANLEKDEPRFSYLSHNFLNVVRLNRDAKKCNFSSHFSGRLILTSSDFILPMDSCLFIQQEDTDILRPSYRTGIPGHRYYSMMWEGNDVTDGIVVQEMDRDNLRSYDIDDNPVSQKDKFSRLLIECAAKQNGDFVLDKRLDLQIIVADSDAITKHQNHQQGDYVGCIPILADESGENYLSPLSPPDASDLVINIYYAYGGYNLYMPSGFTVKVTKVMFEDFFKHIDLDVDFSKGNGAGGGYSYTYLRLNQLHHRFTQEDIDDRVIVLGDPITEEK